MERLVSERLARRIEQARARPVGVQPLSILKTLCAPLEDQTVPVAHKTPGLPSRAIATEQHGWLDPTPEFKRDLKKLDQHLRGRILTAILEINSQPQEVRGDTVKPLGSELRGLWRYRIGDYRLIYEPQPHGVRLICVCHRSDVYD